VQFLQSDENDDVYPAPPARWRRATPAPACGPLLSDRLASASNSLALPLQPARLGCSNKLPGRFAGFGLAFGFLFLLVAATAVFYVAGLGLVSLSGAWNFKI
jgi:hypothetical protein